VLIEIDTVEGIVYVDEMSIICIKPEGENICKLVLCHGVNLICPYSAEVLAEKLSECIN